MLSRLRNEGDNPGERNDIAIIDTEDYVDSNAFMEDDYSRNSTINTRWVKFTSNSCITAC